MAPGNERGETESQWDGYVRESLGKNGEKDQLLTTDGRVYRVPFPPLYDTTRDMI